MLTYKFYLTSECDWEIKIRHSNNLKIKEQRIMLDNINSAKKDHVTNVKSKMFMI